MFLLVASALAGTLIGWPCQRLNWGWRNVWSTCSINSYAPANAPETAAQAPTGFRFSSVVNPTMVLNAGGVFTPTSVTAGVPLLLCQNAPNTGTGATANLRNRCRRAIDAYGALVKSCANAPGISIRGPNNLSPDWTPTAGHIPHLTNVQGLTHNAQFCLLPAGTPAAPGALATPATTCPGLLGWFTVVFNVCGFTNAPSFTPATMATPALAQPNANAYFPLSPVAGQFSPNTLGGAVVALPAGATGLGSVGFFCTSSATVSATSWNQNGAVFKTSRCRKALDQFGRTATRCHLSATTATGPSQAGGYSDPLRLLAVGNVAAAAPTAPAGINVWAPNCN